MPIVSLTDGQSYDIRHPNLTYVLMRGIIFENTAIPGNLSTLITKAPGNPPPWIEFDGSLIPDSPQTRSFKQSNIVSITP